jgi:hypothetical protein
MMGGFFVLSGLMMLSCFAVVTRGMRMMLCRLLMVLGCFLGHGVPSNWWPEGRARPRLLVNMPRQSIFDVSQHQT